MNIEEIPITKELTIEVFRTNVQNDVEANVIIENLHQLIPGNKINFDLDDCDKILRIAGTIIDSELITQFINSKGYICEIL